MQSTRLLFVSCGQRASNNKGLHLRNRLCMDTLQPNPESPEETKIELNCESLVSLLETGGWANFMAILMFVFVGLFILGAISISAFVPSTAREASPFPIPLGLFSALYLLGALLYFFPAYD